MSKTRDEHQDGATEGVALSPDEVSALVAQAVRQTLIQLGIDAENPMEMQRDFQHLRQWRKAGEELRNKSMLTLLGLFLSGLAALILLGLKDWFSS